MGFHNLYPVTYYAAGRALAREFALVNKDTALP